MLWNRKLLAAVGILTVGLVASSGISCRPAPAEDAGERTIYVQATELDARRTVEQDPFPQETVEEFPEYFGPGDDPFERGGAPGYYLFMTAEDEWRIGSYMFVPQEVIAYQGERITMEILGVRGAHHENVLLDPDGEPVAGPDGTDIVFTVRRGELHVIEFTTEKTGIYTLVCVTHQPTMTMNIHVLGR